MVEHCREEHEGVVVCIDSHRNGTGTHAHLKVLQGKQHGQCLILNCGVIQLVSLELGRGIARRLRQTVVFILHQYCFSCNGTRIYFQDEWNAEIGALECCKGGT